MDHQHVIETIGAKMRDVPGVHALFLSGSFGTGLADAFSDIDFVLVADQGATDDMAAHWRAAVEQTGEIVLWWDRTTVPVLINAITADWVRTDVVILKPDQMRSHSKATLKPIFDHDSMYADLPDAPASHVQNPKRLTYQIEEFIRILGLLHLAVGRQEYINGVLGVFHLRNLLVDLMIEETNAPNRGGILHLNRLITEDQTARLISLPPPVPERQAMIDAHMAYAAEYLPRARRRAQAIGANWPERFEDVTWAKLSEALGVECPYDRA